MKIFLHEAKVNSVVSNLNVPKSSFKVLKHTEFPGAVVTELLDLKTNKTGQFMGCSDNWVEGVEFQGKTFVLVKPRKPVVLSRKWGKSPRWGEKEVWSSEDRKDGKKHLVNAL